MAETKNIAKEEKPASAYGRKRELSGLVVSDKMDKTIVVKVDRQVKHPVFQKYIVRSKKFKAHDESNKAKMGDLVTIVECRPLSKHKKFALQKIVREGSKLAAQEVAAKEAAPKS